MVVTKRTVVLSVKNLNATNVIHTILICVYSILVCCSISEVQYCNYCSGIVVDRKNIYFAFCVCFYYSVLLNYDYEFASLCVITVAIMLPYSLCLSWYCLFALNVEFQTFLTPKNCAKSKILATSQYAGLSVLYCDMVIFSVRRLSHGEKKVWQ